MLFRAMMASAVLLCAGVAMAEDKAPEVAGAPPLAAFFDDPIYSSAALSPNGQFLAGVETGDVSAITITDLNADTTVPILPLSRKGGAAKGLTINWLEWKGDDRLLLGVTQVNIQREDGKPDGKIVAFSYSRSIIGVDRDGKNAIKLIKTGTWVSDRGLFVALQDHLRADPDHVLATAPDANGVLNMWKVNVRTGQSELVEAGDPHTLGWRTDATGAVVVRFRAFASGLSIESRAPDKTEWTRIVELRPKGFDALPDFEVLGPTNKPTQFYVAVVPKTPAEGDVRTLRILDIASNTISGPVWPTLNHDVGNIVYDGDTDDLAGVCYTADVYTCSFSDKGLSANFKALSSYFHDERNIVPISVSADARWWLLSVSGPDEPEGYYLFDWRTKQIERIADRFGSLPSEQLATMRRWSYASRDGMAIPAYLTRPRAAPTGPLPLIVMPHGGPEIRDTFAFDVWDQFLATRGYLVFQPNFRGSGGYGVAYGAAGYGQWGGRMADDITDGVRQLIASGQVDPKRICIFGGSFGGYAALQAGATHPELYKCVVSWAGVADLLTFLSHDKAAVGADSPSHQYWLKSIGDPERRQDALVAASPVTYASQYQPPVLLIHGTEDSIVSPDQSRIMEAALKKAGKDVKLIMFKGEDHSDWANEDEIAALTAVANFIEAHIAPALPPSPAVLGASGTPEASAKAATSAAAAP